MKIECWFIGKTAEKYLETGLEIYGTRLKRYFPFEVKIIPDVKVKSSEALWLKNEEGKAVLSKITVDDFLILLDDKGTAFTSEALASWVEQKLNMPHRRLIFLVGGAFGFSDDVYARANFQLSLSKMTFSHQMVRLFLLEQLYRAMSILRNEPYHNP